ncbi:hypothetical protein FCJ61_35515 [Burkholderia metallica]|uniref:imm11 family protein n=1 Tax=Burkholderia metallica TaxID=488729 RepID=UPI00157B8640|nr:DUF1629 domain-containing protein [Burkholderia metallica]NTZ88157.1 hypothetical protein [Burkholderia metallica]
MIYFFTPAKATHGILSYDHAKSVDYSFFLEGVSLKSISAPIIFNVKKESDLKRLSKLHFIRSTGPDLVSQRLREVIEGVAPSEVEFFDVSIKFDDRKVEGFSCLNVLWKLPCIDMEASEYELANFDPNNPEYTFQYMVLRDQTDPPVQVARCEEQPRKLIVGDAIKAACISNSLTGLDFCRAEDLTYKDRTICESI